jgi:hypothetical protein
VPKLALLIPLLLAMSLGSAGGAPAPRFTTPYDMILSGGELWFSDGVSGRVLRFDFDTKRLSLIARIRGSELVGIARAGRTLYAADIRQGLVWKVDERRVTRFASVPAATDLVLRGRTLFVGSLERGIYAIDLRTRRKRLVNRTTRPHGLTLDLQGNLVAGDPPNGIYRIGQNGTATLLVATDAAHPGFAPDGRLYFGQGSPEGGTVRRLEPNGTITTVVGTGKIGPDGEGVPATTVGLQITAFVFPRDGSMLLGQSEPRPAKIRRVDLASGTITTILRSP